jgi:hypothetical protein
MRGVSLAILMAWMAGSVAQVWSAQPYAYDLNFSTYFGGSGSDLIRGMGTDAQGNIYVVGTARGADFPRTPGNTPGQTSGDGAMVAKFSPTGALIWSKVFGTGSEIYFYSVKVDSAGYVYVAGRIGQGFPTTAGAFQPTAAHVCGFVGKLQPDASDWVWASYVGTGYAMRDMTMDDHGDLYGILDYFAESTEVLPTNWFTNAYAKTPHAGTVNHFGHSDAGIIKISNSGTVLWASWIGGSSGNDWVASLGVGQDHCPTIFMTTGSTDMPTTPGAYCRTPSAGGYLARLSADGSSLIFGTYFPGVASAGPRTHGVAVDAQGSTFIAYCANNTAAVTTGAFQTAFGGGPEDFTVMKFSNTGSLLAATFLGGSGDEVNGPDQVFVDGNGNVMICGSTSSINYPLTAGAFQPNNAGNWDGVVSILSNDLGTLLYSSFIGGKSSEMARAGCVGPDGTLYVGGVTTSTNFPTTNAWQSAYAGPFGMSDDIYQTWGNGDGWVAKFPPRQPVPVITVAPVATPNPAAMGQSVSFSVTATSTNQLNYRWSFGDYCIGSGAATAHTYAVPGQFTVTVTVSDDYGGLAAASLPVSVTVPPFAIDGLTMQSTTNLVLSWQSVTGGLYMVESRTRLLAGSWTDVLSNLSATPPSNVITMRQDYVDSGYYRISVR